MSFRRFIALLCLIAGSFGSGTVAALDCTITIGRSCQGEDIVFNIDAQFPLDNRSHLVIANRSVFNIPCGLVVGSGTRVSDYMQIPFRGEVTLYKPGHYHFSASGPFGFCDLSIRGEQDISLTLFDVVCPPAGSYRYGQWFGDWRIWIQSGETATVSQWQELTSTLAPRNARGLLETTQISCQSRGQNLVIATKVIPGNFSCSGKSDDRNLGPLKGTCQRQ